MAITTWTELKTAVASWMQRSDLTSIIPDFIANAEAEFNRTLRLTGALTRADLSVSGRWTALSGLTVPLAEIRSVSVTASGVRYALEYLTPEKAQGFTTTGVPKYYSRSGDELEILPPPDGTYTLELLYWRTLPALSGSVASNYLLTLAPDVYLYRSVIEGAQYVQAQEMLDRIVPMYTRALQQLKDDDVRRQFGGTGLAVRAA